MLKQENRSILNKWHTRKHKIYHRFLLCKGFDKKIQNRIFPLKSIIYKVPKCIKCVFVMCESMWAPVHNREVSTLMLLSIDHADKSMTAKVEQQWGTLTLYN